MTRKRAGWRLAITGSVAAAVVLATGTWFLGAGHGAHASAPTSPLPPARPVLHSTPSAPPVSVVTPPTIEVPVVPSATPPAPPASAHPISSQPAAASLAAAAVAVGRVHDGQFIIDGDGWQIGTDVQVWSGHFAGSGQPAMLESTDGSTVLYPLIILGAPGAARIQGLHGDWVLVQEGLGYEVFDYRTHAVDRSDQSGAPGATTHLQYSEVATQ